MFAGARRSQLNALAAYGETIGIAFQLSDDLLDIATESAQSGKTPGTDLREGVPTLPVLYALAVRPMPTRRRCGCGRSWPTGPVTDDALHAEALGLLRESAALKQARETVRSYAERARTSLAILPDHAGPPCLGVALRLHRRTHRLSPPDLQPSGYLPGFFRVRPGSLDLGRKFLRSVTFHQDR